MDREYLIYLTLSLYQRIDQLENKELIKANLKNLANRILADFVLFLVRNPLPQAERIEVGQDILSEIEEIKNCFELSRNQKLLNRKDFLFFWQEYNKIGQGIKREISKLLREKPELSKEKKSVKNTSAGLNSQRQEKILALLKEKIRLQVASLKEIFPDVSKRTLRRDFGQLLGEGIIERMGEKNNTFYQVKINQS